MWRTPLASLAALLLGVGALAAATAGFRAFTTETARRISVREHAPEVPPARLETSRGQRLELADLRGRWLLVDFIYTHCLSYCVAQGNEFARLQQELAPLIGAGRAQLLSISFDPQRDDPAALAAYQRRSGSQGPGWLAVRPRDAESLRRLLAGFGVVVIADELGGYAHNAAINLVDPRGHLVRVFSWDAAAAARDYIRAQEVTRHVAQGN